MKKILIIVMVLVAGATSTFAISPADSDVFYKLNNSSTFTGLMKYLNADGEQAVYLKQVFALTEEKMKTALKDENEVVAEKAVNFNLGNAKNILTSYQYKRYLTILNLTVSNNYSGEVLLTEK